MRAIFAIFLLMTVPATLRAERPLDHGIYDQLLQQYVDSDGLVQYAALARDRDRLDAYVDTLARYSPESHPGRFPDRNCELAYWINAYNAFVLKGVIDAYPIASVKGAFVFGGFFNREEFVAGGRSLTLNDIENDIIRPEYREPRIHFAVNCAAMSCPQLENRAFTGPDLDFRLERALERFARDPKYVKLGGSILYLSKILDWYGGDFSTWFPPNRPNPKNKPPIVNYLLPYLPAETAAQLATMAVINLEYYDYDWSLNEKNEKGSLRHAEDSP